MGVAPLLAFWRTGARAVRAGQGGAGGGGAAGLLAAVIGAVGMLGAAFQHLVVTDTGRSAGWPLRQRYVCTNG
ncbi:hypothetical protein ACIG3E_25325 [Streptomyces sp. NPDC053474]|uniref:hypothetical protein n=1 Tax=Streptomyces sp. NPDC053474 TaxID=3365704 RepID=UPI0037D7E6CE